MHSHKIFERKLKKVLKTDLFAIFATGFNREQVAITLKTKILKNFISVFRDRKFYPRGSRDVSRENL